MDPNYQYEENDVAGALESAEESEEEETFETDRLPRRMPSPMSLNRLLISALEATKEEDGTSGEYGPMDEERKKFLEEALRSMTSNMSEVLTRAIRILSDVNSINGIHFRDPLPDTVCTAFNNLLEVVDDIDLANDFYKMGGFSLFPVCFGCENEQVRMLACSVLAEVCQNNPYCQARALEYGLLNLLLNMMNTERCLVLSKVVSAISCACREFDPSSRELIAQGGCKSLVALLASEEPMVRTKSAFLIRNLSYNYPDARKQFVDLGIIRTIADLLKEGRDNTSEHLLGVLLSLLEDGNPVVFGQFREPCLNLKAVLERHLQHPDLVYDMFREEMEYCHEILKRVFENYPPVDCVEEIADRLTEQKI